MSKQHSGRIDTVEWQVQRRAGAVEGKASTVGKKLGVNIKKTSRVTSL